MMAVLGDFKKDSWNEIGYYRQKISGLFFNRLPLGFILIRPWYVALIKRKRLQDYKRSFKYSQRILPVQLVKLNCNKKGNFLYYMNTFSL